MAKTQRHYDTEFKIQAVALAKDKGLILMFLHLFISFENFLKK